MAPIVEAFLDAETGSAADSASWPCTLSPRRAWWPVSFLRSHRPLRLQRRRRGPVGRAVACWCYRSRENLGIGQVERPVGGIQPDVGDADLGHGPEELAAQWS